MKKKNRHDGVTDAVKAMRKGNREAEMELLGPGFHSRHSIHKSANIYTRKEKQTAKLRLNYRQKMISAQPTNKCLVNSLQNPILKNYANTVS